MNKLLICLMTIPMMVFQPQEKEFVEMKEVEEFRNGIKEMAAKIHAIKASFEQDKYLSILSDAVKSSGIMYFKKPNLLKWSYTAPYSYGILLDGEKVHINDEGNVNSFDVGNSKVFRKLNDLIINSVQGNILEDEQFDITYFESEDLYLARLVPKEQQMKDYVSQMDVFFEKDNYTVEKIRLNEPGGDYTLLTFQNKEINAPIADDEFSFE